MLKKLFGNLVIDLIVALLVMAIGAYTFRHPSSPLVKYFEAQKAAETAAASPVVAPAPTAPALAKQAAPKAHPVEKKKAVPVRPKSAPAPAERSPEDAEAAILKDMANGSFR